MGVYHRKKKGPLGSQLRLDLKQLILEWPCPSSSGGLWGFRKEPRSWKHTHTHNKHELYSTGSWNIEVPLRPFRLVLGIHRFLWVNAYSSTENWVVQYFGSIFQYFIQYSGGSRSWMLSTQSHPENFEFCPAGAQNCSGLSHNTNYTWEVNVCY